MQKTYSCLRRKNAKAYDEEKIESARFKALDNTSGLNKFLPISKERTDHKGRFFLLYKGYEKDIFRGLPLGFELKRVDI